MVQGTEDGVAPPEVIDCLIAEDAQSLDDILRHLDSDCTRFTFLHQLYFPGNVVVADRILAVNPGSTDIMEREIAYARRTGEDGRSKALLDQMTDWLLRNNCDILLRDVVIQYGDKELAEHVISSLSEQGSAQSLESAAAISLHFGNAAESRQLLERYFLLKHEGKRKNHPAVLARTAVKLERFRDAIDLYLRAGHKYFDEALEVAQMHVSERTEEIARLGFKGYVSDVSNQEHHFPHLYVKSAKILGREEKAKEWLRRDAKRLVITTDPFHYRNLVEAMMSLDLKGEARLVAEKVEADQMRMMDEDLFYNGAHQKVVYQLFLAVGDEKKAALALRRKIEKELPQKIHSSASGQDIKATWQDIDEVYRLTRDETVFRQKISYFEREGQYQEAADVARALGWNDSADRYETMRRMVSTVQARRSDC